MKTNQDFKNIESYKRFITLKKVIDMKLLSKPLGDKLKEYRALSRLSL